jgi:hypothetical protein
MQQLGTTFSDGSRKLRQLQWLLEKWGGVTVEGEFKNIRAAVVHFRQLFRHLLGDAKEISRNLN